MDIVIGLGIVGDALHKILKKKTKVMGYDSMLFPKKMFHVEHNNIRILHICFRYNDEFIKEVNRYRDMVQPELTIIHSTVPIGTTAKIPHAVHSPVLGKHDNMKKSLLKFIKWVGGKDAKKAGKYLRAAGFKCRIVNKSEETEALKLFCLAKYGMSIAFAGYQQKLCNIYKINYSKILDWDKDYNKNVQNGLQRPILHPPINKIGGHCVIQNTELLNKQYPNQILDEILRYK